MSEIDEFSTYVRYYRSIVPAKKCAARCSRYNLNPTTTALSNHFRNGMECGGGRVGSGGREAVRLVHLGERDLAFGLVPIRGFVSLGKEEGREKTEDGQRP